MPPSRSRPLFAAGSALGARYFYLPSIGFAWAVAEAVAGIGGAARLTILALILGVGGLQAAKRRGDVVSYDRRVAAARRAVTAGMAAGHRVFHIDGGIKDLDLAVKQHRDLAPAARDVLVLNDVPASFAIVPDQLRDAASMRRRVAAAAALGRVPVRRRPHRRPRQAW